MSNQEGTDGSKYPGETTALQEAAEMSGQEAICMTNRDTWPGISEPVDVAMHSLQYPLQSSLQSGLAERTGLERTESYGNSVLEDINVEVQFSTVVGVHKDNKTLREHNPDNRIESGDSTVPLDVDKECLDDNSYGEIIQDGQLHEKIDGKNKERNSAQFVNTESALDHTKRLSQIEHIPSANAHLERRFSGMINQALGGELQFILFREEPSVEQDYESEIRL